MISIIKATEKDSELLSALGKQTFLESHGHSAPEKDISNYIARTYTQEIVRADLADPKNIYHLIYLDEEPAGYSKIIFNTPHPDIPVQNITKLDRIYLLKKHHGSGAAAALLQFNIQLAKQNDQQGLWLYTWKENHRAIHFYTKRGFTIIGSHDFKLSETHSNPNHLMVLMWKF